MFPSGEELLDFGNRDWSIYIFNTVSIEVFIAIIYTAMPISNYEIITSTITAVYFKYMECQNGFLVRNYFTEGITI